jgi:hypothetical protein
VTNRVHRSLPESLVCLPPWIVTCPKFPHTQLGRDEGCALRRFDDTVVSWKFTALSGTHIQRDDLVVGLSNQSANQPRKLVGAEYSSGALSWGFALG